MLQDIIKHLRCPEDFTPLVIEETGLRCSFCLRLYPRTDEYAFDLLPAEPNPAALAALCPEHRAVYIEEYRRRVPDAGEMRPWGAPETLCASLVYRKRLQAARIYSVLAAGERCEDLIFCDLSAGAGYYSLSYAEHFRWVLHCDLSSASVMYGSHHAKRLGLKNFLCLRIDYFRPPFVSIDRIACMDSLIRGAHHERNVLSAIKHSLSAGGVAVVDFHNWWRNPFRRLGLLRNNFCNNHSYSKEQARRLVLEAGIESSDYFPFDEAFSSDKHVDQILRSILPPSRLTFRFRPQ
jgi:SAM-dependent methyltransferase